MQSWVLCDHVCRCGYCKQEPVTQISYALVGGGQVLWSVRRMPRADIHPWHLNRFLRSWVTLHPDIHNHEALLWPKYLYFLRNRKTFWFGFVICANVAQTRWSICVLSVRDLKLRISVQRPFQSLPLLVFLCILRLRIYEIRVLNALE